MQSDRLEDQEDRHRFVDEVATASGGTALRYKSNAYSGTYSNPSNWYGDGVAPAPGTAMAAGQSGGTAAALGRESGGMPLPLSTAGGRGSGNRRVESLRKLMTAQPGSDGLVDDDDLEWGAGQVIVSLCCQVIDLKALICVTCTFWLLPLNAALGLALI